MNWIDRDRVKFNRNGYGKVSFAEFISGASSFFQVDDRFRCVTRHIHGNSSISYPYESNNVSFETRMCDDYLELDYELYKSDGLFERAREIYHIDESKMREIEGIGTDKGLKTLTNINWKDARESALRKLIYDKKNIRYTIKGDKLEFPFVVDVPFKYSDATSPHVFMVQEEDSELQEDTLRTFSNMLREVPNEGRMHNVYDGMGEIGEIFGMPDLIMFDNRLRYDIPLLFKYMRGLVDIKNIKVYVNFNEYKTQNEYKEKIFKTLCADDECLYFWIPITDHVVPSLNQLTFWIKLCDQCRRHQLNMYYQCGSGDGRTGFMTMCNLLCMLQENDKHQVADFMKGVKEAVPKEMGTWGEMVGKRDTGRYEATFNPGVWFESMKNTKLYKYLKKGEYISEESLAEIFQGRKVDGIYGYPILPIERIMLLEKLLSGDTEDTSFRRESLSDKDPMELYRLGRNQDHLNRDELMLAVKSPDPKEALIQFLMSDVEWLTEQFHEISERRRRRKREQNKKLKDEMGPFAGMSTEWHKNLEIGGGADIRKKTKKNKSSSKKKKRKSKKYSKKRKHSKKKKRKTKRRTKRRTKTKRRIKRRK